MDIVIKIDADDIDHLEHKDVLVVESVILIRRDEGGISQLRYDDLAFMSPHKAQELFNEVNGTDDFFRGLDMDEEYCIEED